MDSNYIEDRSCKDYMTDDRVSCVYEPPSQDRQMTTWSHGAMPSVDDLCHSLSFESDLTFCDMYCRDIVTKREDSPGNCSDSAGSYNTVDYSVTTLGNRGGHWSENIYSSSLDTGFSVDDVSDTSCLRQCSQRSITKDKTCTSRRVPELVRIGATVRERTRMHMLNDAFDALRKVVPKHNLGDHQKMSKIATLRLAIQYISTLAMTLRTSGIEIRKVPGLCVGDRRGKRRRSTKNGSNNRV